MIHRVFGDHLVFLFLFLFLFFFLSLFIHLYLFSCVVELFDIHRVEHLNEGGGTYMFTVRKWDIDYWWATPTQLHVIVV